MSYTAPETQAILQSPAGETRTRGCWPLGYSVVRVSPIICLIEIQAESTAQSQKGGRSSICPIWVVSAGPFRCLANHVCPPAYHEIEQRLKRTVDLNAINNMATSLIHCHNVYSLQVGRGDSRHASTFQYFQPRVCHLDLDHQVMGL